ncbi:hypothetical protein ElyMa_006451200 [Elysia marginata]|uniref:Uncharacterized protein n=1 Tax=Elysia marginata TaxID=1093978 RepID=A0AAV4I140_9GAST|nr:hypothetical protein ElyMa_006451200 [Elysia marginata]
METESRFIRRVSSTDDSEPTPFPCEDVGDVKGENYLKVFSSETCRTLPYRIRVILKSSQLQTTAKVDCPSGLEDNYYYETANHYNTSTEFPLENLERINVKDNCSYEFI